MTAVTVSGVQSRFSCAADLVRRDVQVGEHTLPVFFLDGLTASGMISEYVLAPLAALPAGTQEVLCDACLRGAVCNAVAKPCEDLDALEAFLVNGFCTVLFPALEKAVAFEVKTGEKRAPSPPEVEPAVKGAKDAFTETSRTNTSLVRRHLRTANLMVEESVLGSVSGTNVSLLSLRGITDPSLTAMVRRRLQSLHGAAYVSPAAVEESLTGGRTTAFPLVQYTERTDKFCQGLLSGQVGIIVDGLPLGYLLPVDVGRFLSAQEDLSVDYLTASAVRIIRCTALLLSLLLPALYIAMAQFSPSMIPTRLLESIIRSKENVPFPTVLEVLGLLVAFELLQEAGLHLPRSVGHTVSILGGLVVGTAAVEASFISPAALVVVAVAGICGFAMPGTDFADALRLWRFALGVCAAVAGLYGLTLGIVCLAVHLGSLTSCGRPYLMPLSSLRVGGVLLRRRLVKKSPKR